MNARPSYVLRPMRHEDIAQVVSIDRLSFPMPWSYNTYRYEISHNPSSTMVTLSLDSPGEAATSSNRNGLPGLVNRLLGRQMPGRDSIVVGYGGFWLMLEEAHICTLAIDAAWRGHGLGTWLLLALLSEATHCYATVATLEVRVSNQIAQNLYRQLGFEVVGRRPRYYTNNGEDALIMTLPNLADDAVQARLAERRAATARRLRTLARTLQRRSLPTSNP